jgi:long-chain acyl-CoA synthetase
LLLNKPWLSQYPAGVPAEIDLTAYPSLLELIDEGVARHAQKTAYVYMGRRYSFAQLDELSRAFAAYLQGAGLARGDRVAVMLPNVPQYPVAVVGILRAGCVVVNVNPLYTARELEHQLQDAGARAILILENFAATLQQVIQKVPTQQVIVAALGDLLGLLKGAVVNHVVRHRRRLVPPFSLPGAVRFNTALAEGRRRPYTRATASPEDVAVLQYTGGTTGVSKGAVLLHRNLVANLLQSQTWYEPALSRIPADEQVVTVCALPLYHIFGFTAVMMRGLHTGGCSILIPNARDLTALLKALAGQRFHSFPGVNTLFNALVHHPDFQTVDWRALQISVGGGMAVQSATAQAWLNATGCPILEAYGLSETSPAVTCNPVTATHFTGSIGVPLPSTEVVLLDDAGHPVPQGEPGELAVRGPQVMAGYWQRPDETAKVMTADGYFRTGDIAVMDEHGYFRIVDRKKDMILVSGFNVYPNEIEDVLTQHPGVLEAAAVGVPDDKSGEAVKVVVVRKDPALNEAEVRAWCETNLTGYKRPKVVEFRSELPKTPVGKILRRELRSA